MQFNHSMWKLTIGLTIPVKGETMNILLLTMPFHKPTIPSIGLTQIKGRLMALFKEKIAVTLLYLNHDFFNYFGEDMYLAIADSFTYNGLNDWLFRKEAFAGVTDNQTAYLQQFFPTLLDDQKTYIQQKVEGLGMFIDRLITEYDILSYDLVGVNANFSVDLK